MATENEPSPDGTQGQKSNIHQLQEYQVEDKKRKLDDSSPTESDEAGKPTDESQTLRKPFRNPVIRNSPLNNSRQSNRAKIKELERDLVRLQDGERILKKCMIEKVEKDIEKWVDVGREAAEYLWNLVGEDTLAEAKNSKDQSRERWGYEVNNDWGWDKTEAFPDTDQLEEDLPSANEIIGESTPMRRYNAHGLANHPTSTSQKNVVESLKPSENEKDSEPLIAPKIEKNVAWMMEKMGLDPKIFGWNADDGDWTS